MVWCALYSKKYDTQFFINKFRGSFVAPSYVWAETGSAWQQRTPAASNTFLRSLTELVQTLAIAETCHKQVPKNFRD